MSYWDLAETKVNQLKKSGWVSADDIDRQDALRLVNLQHTDPKVAAQMQSTYKSCDSVATIQAALNTTGAALSELGAKAKLPKGTEFLHLILGNWFNRSVGNTAYMSKDFVDKFPDYLQRRIAGNKVLWVTPKCDTALDLSGVVGVARQLGLHHFGAVPVDVPIAVFHLRTKMDLELLKPTWAHAFDGWYFDPAPESYANNPPHGWARCLETGDCLRKEWVVHPKHLSGAFEVVSATLSLDVSSSPSSLDFHKLGSNYWAAVQKRISNFGK